MITIFTPSFADEDNTNAQNLTVKEIVSRLPEDQFRVVMICSGTPDPRIAARKNTKLLPYHRHGNTLQILARSLFTLPNIYYFPRCGPLDRAFLDLRKYLPIRTALVSYIVMMMNEVTSAGLIGRSIIEANQVCANSKYVSGTVQERFGVQPMTIYDGVDQRFFFFHPADRDARSSRPPVVLYAGSFQPRKRVELVIEQAARCPDVQFRLAGSGVTENGCRALSQRLGCGNVAFLGHLASVQLGEEMRKADIFLFPSVLEGHPQVLLQAAACGLPSIAMNLYRPDYVVNNETGFLVESDTELAEKFDVLLGDRALREAMSYAAVRHARNFDWDRITEQWATLFQKVVAERHRHSD